MTKSEKRKQDYEKLVKNETEKEKICVTTDTLKMVCDDCEFCKKGQITQTECKWICLSKARQDMLISTDPITGDVISCRIGYYPYGIVCGKCGFMAYMRIIGEK